MSTPTSGEIAIFCAMLQDFRDWSSSRVAMANEAKAAGDEQVDPMAIAAMDIVGRMFADKFEEIVRAGTSPTMALATFAQMIGMLIGRWGIAQTAQGFPLQLTNIVINAVDKGVAEQKAREDVSTKRH